VVIGEHYFINVSSIPDILCVHSSSTQLLLAYHLDCSC